MATATTPAQLEREAGKKAARTLRKDLRQQVARRFTSRSGSLKKITATHRMKRGELQRIAIKAPKHGFIQHYGFEKRKNNGVFQRLKGTNFLNHAINKNGAIEKLADDISNIRGDEVVAKINL